MTAHRAFHYVTHSKTHARNKGHRHHAARRPPMPVGDAHDDRDDAAGGGDHGSHRIRSHRPDERDPVRRLRALPEGRPVAAAAPDARTRHAHEDAIGHAQQEPALVRRAAGRRQLPVARMPREKRHPPRARHRRAVGSRQHRRHSAQGQGARHGSRRLGGVLPEPGAHRRLLRAQDPGTDRTRRHRRDDDQGSRRPA